jgi:hypothetical protein
MEQKKRKKGETKGRMKGNKEEMKEQSKGNKEEIAYKEINKRN